MAHPAHPPTRVADVLVVVASLPGRRRVGGMAAAVGVHRQQRRLALQGRGRWWRCGGHASRLLDAKHPCRLAYSPSCQLLAASPTERATPSSQSASVTTVATAAHLLLSIVRQVPLVQHAPPLRHLAIKGALAADLWQAACIAMQGEGLEGSPRRRPQQRAGAAAQRMPSASGESAGNECTW